VHYFKISLLTKVDEETFQLCQHLSIYSSLCYFVQLALRVWLSHAFIENLEVP